MGKHLLLLLLLLLGLSVLLGCVQALKCFQCPRFNAAGTCESLEGVCETRGSQQCFLKKVYEGRRSPARPPGRWLCRCPSHLNPAPEGHAQFLLIPWVAAASHQYLLSALSPAGGSLQHGSQGCEDLCVPMSFSRPNIEVDFMCCGDQSFCNKFEA
uniref:UPAR/Ly6 domain-containing protein n=1 Tax=Oryctolagus cuniculus TaxID=9986 RepID=A0A5F9C3P6_RABIT